MYWPSIARSINRDTIVKELKTLRQAWTWVASRLPGTPPPGFALKDERFPKGTEAIPFMTWDEIEREVARGGPKALWDALWLDKAQVRELVAHVSIALVSCFIPHAVRAAAYSGMRRSELCRSMLSDWRIDDGMLKVRQKKRDLERDFTTRDLPIHLELAGWLASHPGGTHAFCLDDGSPLT